MNGEISTHSTSAPTTFKALLGDGIIGWKSTAYTSEEKNNHYPNGSVIEIPDYRNSLLIYLHYYNELFINRGKCSPILLGGTPKTIVMGLPMLSIVSDFRYISYDIDNYTTQCEETFDFGSFVIEAPSQSLRSWKEVETRYQVDRPLDTREFIEKNRVAIKSILEIPNKLTQYFGPYKQLRLGILEDPDAINYIKVLIEIVTEMEPDKAYDCLLNFGEKWWLDVNPDTRKIITLNLAYL